MEKILLFGSSCLKSRKSLLREEFRDFRRRNKNLIVLVHEIALKKIVTKICARFGLISTKKFEKKSVCVCPRMTDDVIEILRHLK